MSQRRIKKNRFNGRNDDWPPKTQGPLDWIRTDDKSIEECFYILLLTRGLYPVLEGLAGALNFEADACREQKAHVGGREETRRFWLREAEFCDEVIDRIRGLAKDLHEKWSAEERLEQPLMLKRREPVVGAIYPLPGGGVYIPKR